MSGRQQRELKCSLLVKQEKIHQKGVMETTRGEAVKKAQMLGDLDFDPGSGREEQ